MGTVSDDISLALRMADEADELTLARFGALDLAVTSFVSGFANVGNSLSGLFFRGTT